MFDRRLLECFDWGLFLLTLSICGLGLGVLYSAVNAAEVQGMAVIFKKQMIWMGAGFFIMFSSFLVHYKFIDKASLLIYFICVALLAAVLIFGRNAGGSTRWLALGPFTVQPSELMKLSMIIVLASVYSTCVTEEGLGFHGLLKPVGLLVLPFLFILKQPDLGTAMLILFIAASMTLFVHVQKKVFFSCAALAAGAAPLLWFFVLKEYQKARILTFLNPDRDPLGAGYHIIQSKIAIGSGMMYGKGFLKGTQNALSFLPEQHTDFILSVLAEEWGFVGCCVLLILYFLFLLWGFNIAYGCRDMFGSILAFGITIMIFWQIFINIGMVMGLMPVVGVPLPLISYGGSSVITNMVGIGLLMNISMRRFLSG
ncbi:cell elongation-specific peptidoglycan biosynthesis regulator RodA [Desulfocicer vacuolatum DSM 3385]|uniref:Peptidoglycan glycosyltransferase RodA n=1 Tax=Desulfocicer vacuolatum DSM 3385 TaxID=1121400 RepID=A0A1W1YZT9_9BACT|nr:rod shape-determining protein RodA [Desulfocicer vacuolatum]SMC41592.1 cell elongation-specific peptidoglycan biosynthesis regulator RodA [Desulfocicer vacuolatum DSM 3385]